MSRYRMMTGLGAGMALLVTGGLLADPPLMQPGAPGTAARPLTPEQSIGLATSGHSQADARFMQHMIVHHGQAVEMGALIAGRTDNPQIALIGDRIARSQSSEIEMMQAWLQRRGLSTEMQHAASGHMMASADEPHAGHGMSHADAAPSDIPLMTGMLSPARMTELAAARDEHFDRLYLVGMIHHHQGAIDMVNDLLAEPGNGQDPQLSEFLSAVMADQSSEIARMRNLLAGL
ncbi:DUF305 domain-containing protein [uncultured Maricaulis sp.]|uniref:DUF305 domain-containing protein n=1 Tax=uncultured Maricaulis sp. TaxID=174710 RepID=UPI0030DAF982